MLKIDFSKLPQFLNRMITIQDDIVKNTAISSEEMIEIIAKSNEVSRMLDLIINDSLGLLSKNSNIAVNESYIQLAVDKFTKSDALTEIFTINLKSNITKFKPETIEWLNKAENPLRAKACVYAAICCWYFGKEGGGKNKFGSLPDEWENMTEGARTTYLKNLTKKIEKKTSVEHGKKLTECFNEVNKIFRSWHEEDKDLLYQLFKPHHAFHIWNSLYSLTLQKKANEKNQNTLFMLNKMKAIYSELLLRTRSATAKLIGVTNETVKEVATLQHARYSNNENLLKVYLDKVAKVKLENNIEQLLIAELEVIKACNLAIVGNTKTDLPSIQDYKKLMDEHLLTLSQLPNFKLNFADISINLSLIDCFPFFDKSINDFRMVILKMSDLLKAKTYITSYIKLLSIYKILLEGLKGAKDPVNIDLMKFQVECSKYDKSYAIYHESIARFQNLYSKKVTELAEKNFEFIFENVFVEVARKRLKKALKKEIAEQEAKYKATLIRNKTGKVIPFYATESKQKDNSDTKIEKEIKNNIPIDEWILNCELGYRTLYAASLLEKNKANNYINDSDFQACQEGLNYYLLVLKKYSNNPLVQAASACGLAWGYLIMAKLFRKNGEINEVTKALKEASFNLNLASDALAVTDTTQISEEHVNLIYFLNEEAENLLGDIKKFQYDLSYVNFQRAHLETRLERILSNKEDAISFYGPKYCWLALNHQKEHKGPYNYIIRAKLLQEIKTHSSFSHMTDEEIASYGWRHNPLRKRSQKTLVVEQEVKELQRQMLDTENHFIMCNAVLDNLKQIEMDCNQLIKKSQSRKYHFLIPNRPQEEIEQLLNRKPINFAELEKTAATEMSKLIPLSTLSPLSPWEQGFTYGVSQMPLNSEINPDTLQGHDLNWYRGYKEGCEEAYKKQFPTLQESRGNIKS